MANLTDEILRLIAGNRKFSQKLRRGSQSAQQSENAAGVTLHMLRF